MNRYDVMNLDPNDMPTYLNELASEYFSDNFDVRMQLSQCSLYIHTINAFLDREKPSDEGYWVMQPGKTASIPPYYIWKCKYCGREVFTEKPIAPDVSCPNCGKGKQPEVPKKISLDCWENNPILLTSNPPKLLWKCKYCGKEITTGVSEVPTTICSCLEENKVIPEAKFIDVDMQMRIIKGDMQYLAEKVDKLSSLLDEQKVKGDTERPQGKWGEWIRLDLAKRVIAKFAGYLDEDMIERIQIALEKEYEAAMKGGAE